MKITVTQREFSALVSAAALYSVSLEGEETTPEERANDAALTRLIRKCQEQGAKL